MLAKAAGPCCQTMIVFLVEVEARIPKGHFKGKFDVAILQLGGNDMDGNRCPLLFASKMGDFTNLLRSGYEIQYIYVCRNIHQTPT